MTIVLPLQMLQQQLDLIGIEAKWHPRFQEAFKSSWQMNGNSLSMIYTGTAALTKSSKVALHSPTVCVHAHTHLVTARTCTHMYMYTHMHTRAHMSTYSQAVSVVG